MITVTHLRTQCSMGCGQERSKSVPLGVDLRLPGGPSIYNLRIPLNTQCGGGGPPNTEKRADRTCGHDIFRCKRTCNWKTLPEGRGVGNYIRERNGAGEWRTKWYQRRTEARSVCLSTPQCIGIEPDMAVGDLSYTSPYNTLRGKGGWSLLEIGN